MNLETVPLDAYTVRNCWGYVLFNIPLFNSRSQIYIFLIHPNRQPRMAPNALQDTHHQLQPLSESSHLVPSQPTSNYTPPSSSPASGGLRPLPHILPRRRSPVLPPPSSGHHVRGRGPVAPGKWVQWREIHCLQDDRLHLGIRMVHIFYADMVKPAGAR